jgi:asparagine synthase (glutamine-hydrolysing)
MVQAGGAQIQSFNVGFEESSFDETEYAQFVAKKMGTKHHTFLFTKSVMQSYAEKIFSQMDEPFADPSFFPSSFLCEHAKPYVKVVLGGDAGDELFGGYPTYYARKISNYFPALPMRVLGHLAQLLPVSDENISFDFKLKKFLGGFETKNADLRHQLWLGAFSPNQAKDILHSGKANGAAAGLMKSHMKDCHFSGWERSQWSDLRFYLQDDMLVKMDRAGMMNGLEVRVPFLDLPLADFALKLPAELKYKGNISKYLLRKLAAKALPSEISERPKKGFGMPVAKWIKSELREGFEAVFSESPAYSSGFFRQDKINSLYREHINGQADHRKLLWPVFVFENWYSKAHKGSL